MLWRPHDVIETSQSGPKKFEVIILREIMSNKDAFEQAITCSNLKF